MDRTTAFHLSEDHHDHYQIRRSSTENTMTQVNLPVRSSAVPWPTSDDRPRSSSGAVLPVREQSPSVAGDLAMNVRPDADGVMDRTAARVAASARPMGDILAVADERLPAQAHEPANSRHGWLGGLRKTICGSPLMSVSAALALGAAVVRLAR